MDIETVNRLISASRPARRVLKASLLIVAGMAILLVSLWSGAKKTSGFGTVTLLLPQVALLLIVPLLLWAGYRQRRLRQLMTDGFEAVQLQDWPRARERLERLLSHPVEHPQARAQSLLALSAVAEAEGHYDLSQHLCEQVIEDGEGDPLQQHTAHVALAAAMLRNEQTTDAVTLIDRLTQQDLPEALRAQVEMLNLFREVIMGHTYDSLTKVDARRPLFRKHLGTRAGFSYGLLAAAFDRHGKTDEAARCWHDATLLISPEKLTRRFRELEPVAARYAPAEHPW